MTTSGDVGTEIAPEVADDPELAARLDDLLHRACSLARALTDAEQAALSVDLDGDGHAARKFFNLSARYARWRDFRVEPRDRTAGARQGDFRRDVTGVGVSAALRAGVRATSAKMDCDAGKPARRV